MDTDTWRGVLRPGFEGANIRTWIGFKHFMYLAEAAVLEWFRERGIGPGTAYHRHGLGLSVVDSSVLLPAVLEVDDLVVAEAKPTRDGRFTVRLFSTGNGADGTKKPALRGTVRVAAVREREPAEPAPPPDPLTPLVVDGVAGAADGAERAGVIPVRDADPATVLAPAGSPLVCWKSTVPYFHCHYSSRMQHSGYVRALEDVVERFLALRGISVGRLLAERGWIPVVSRARVRLLSDAYLEETMYTTFTIEEVLKEVTFGGRMDCYAARGNELVHAATATILHGYAVTRGAGAGDLARFDAEVLDALRGEHTVVGGP